MNGNAIIIELPSVQMQPAIRSLDLINYKLMQMQANYRALQGMQLQIAGGGGSRGGGASLIGPLAPVVSRTPKPPAAPKTFESKLWDVFKTSRITAAGGLEPLVGKLAGAFGPIGIVIAAAGQFVIGFGKAIYEATDHVAQMSLEMNKLRYQAGGTGPETGQLAGLSSLLGTDAGSMARSFADALASNGQATGFGAKAGIYDYGVQDDTNKAQKFLKFLDYVRKTSEKEAMRATRSTGTEPLLQMREMSDKDFNSFKAMSSFSSEVFSPEQTRQAMEFKAALNDLGTASSAAFIEFMKLTHAMEGITVIMRSLTDKFMVMAIGAAALRGDSAETAKLLQQYQEYTRAQQGAQASAMDRHTDAMNEHSRALRDGTFGGGERTRGAMPNRWHGANSEVWGSRVAQLGAFAMHHRETVPGAHYRRPLVRSAPCMV